MRISARRRNWDWSKFCSFLDKLYNEDVAKWKLKLLTKIAKMLISLIFSTFNLNLILVVPPREFESLCPA